MLVMMHQPQLYQPWRLDVSPSVPSYSYGVCMPLCRTAHRLIPWSSNDHDTPGVQHTNGGGTTIAGTNRPKASVIQADPGSAEHGSMGGDPAD